MVREFGTCEECKKHKDIEKNNGLCEKCHEAMYAVGSFPAESMQDEPEFELENEVATLTPTGVTISPLSVRYPTGSYWSEKHHKSISFNGSGQSTIEIRQNGIILVHGHETTDPLTIGVALLEWANKYVFKETELDIKID